MENNNENPIISGSETHRAQSHMVLRFIERLSQKWESLPPDKKIYFIQLGLIAVVQAADILTTYAFFQTVPNSFERNPVARFLLDEGGIVVVGLAKMGGAAGMMAYMEMVRNKWMKGETSPAINNILRIWNSLYTAVSVNNAVYLIMK